MCNNGDSPGLLVFTNCLLLIFLFPVAAWGYIVGTIYSWETIQGKMSDEDLLVFILNAEQNQCCVFKGLHNVDTM